MIARFFHACAGLFWRFKTVFDTRLLLFLQGGGWAKKKLLEYETALSFQLEKLVSANRPPGHKGGKPTKSELKQLIPAALRDGPTLPRYARMNPLRTTMRATLSCLRAEGWDCSAAPPPESPEFAAGPPPPRSVWIDPHVPTLLTFPHGTDLHHNELVTSGGLLLQDKASCFPATAMLPAAAATAAATDGGAAAAATEEEQDEEEEEGDWIDCCAAPGNKTLHLTALLAAFRAARADPASAAAAPSAVAALLGNAASTTRKPGHGKSPSQFSSRV